MKALADFFYDLYAKAIILPIFLLIEVVILIRTLNSDTSSITISQYLQLIEETNPTICYTRKTNMAEEVECRVCLSEVEEGQNVRSLKCRHTFHKDCLDQWLLQNWATCPLCRTKVMPDDVVTKYRQLRNQVNHDGDVVVVDHDDRQYQNMSLLYVLRAAATLFRYLWNLR